MNTIIAIFIGGGLGSVARFGVAEYVSTFWKGSFPLATLIANLLSCIVMGGVIGYFSSKTDNIDIKAMIVIGFCGGFSTFSTFSKDTLQLMQSGNFLIALINILISVVFGVAILWVLTQKAKL